MSPVRRAAVALLAAAAMAACANDEPPEAAPAAALTPSPAPGAVAGIGVSTSDVEGEPDVALWDGWVLALPAGAAPDLWAAAGVDAPDDTGLPHASALVDPGMLAELSGEVAAIGEGGRFVLDVEPESYLVCRLGGDEQPASVQGCGRLDLAPGDAIVLSRGEEGTRVRHADEQR